MRRAGSRRQALGLRLLGCLFGLGAWTVGLYSLFGGGEAMSEPGRERALGYGVVALVVGTVAIVGSIASRDVHALWYCTPRRWRLFRGGR